MSIDIHPTAIVHPQAILGDGSSVGPFSVVGPDVRAGKGNRIGSHVVLEGRTTLGDENVIFQFASVGAVPQDLKYHGEPSTLEIGNKNIVREYVTLQPGTSGGGMRTVIGDSNLFMACSHVGHDGIVGSHNIFANGAALAGHVWVGNRVIVGGLSGIHQFVRLGDMCMLGAGAMVAKDIPPFCTAQGDRACLVGLNSVGLERAGLSSQDVSRLKKVYRGLFFSSEGTLAQRASRLRSEYSDFVQAQKLIEFIESSPRGVASPRSKSDDNQE